VAGGHDKGCDFGDLARAIAENVQGAAFFGAIREALQERVRRRNRGFPCTAVETLAEAVSWCWSQSRPGDAILFSPAYASGRQFRNFRERGQEFDDLVGALTIRPNR
jgi:UDP-N-acetylmuramoylalanine--D-glutamate ligase